MKYLSLIFVIIVVVLGYFGGWWDGIFHQTPVVIEKPTQPITPGITMSKTKLTGWDQEQKSWEIEADRIWQTTNGSIVHFENIRNGIIFSVEGKTVTFKAGWARFEKWQRLLFVGGNLEAYLDEKQFTTSEALMDYGRQKMIFNHQIKVTGDNLLIQAGRLEIDLVNEELLLENNAELIQDNDRVNAKGLKYSLKTEQFELLEPEGVTLSL